MIDLDQLVPAEFRTRLLELRHHLHRNPELSFKEEKTSARLEEELRSVTNDVKRVAGTGLLARIPGKNRSLPAIGIRGDMDALPIREATGLPYQSQNDGVMHACGHDVHSTWVVGAAHLLARSPADSDVVLLLQPGEETGRGAPLMIEEGALEGISQIFGAHVDRRFPLGQVVADEGALAASTDTFTVTARSGGAHGARPHEAPDPVLAIAQFIVAAQAIVARRIDPAAPAVVTLGQLAGGRAPNVIPTEASTCGTIRATMTSTRETIHQEIKNIAAGVSKMHGLPMDVDILSGPGPVVNPAEITAVARAAVVKVLGENALVPFGLVNMAGEDFSGYQAEIPGCFLRIGARYEDGEVIPAHSPLFYAEDESIFVGAAVLAECARQAASVAAARSEAALPEQNGV